MDTTFGIMPANTDLLQKEQVLTATGIKLIRIPLFIQQQGTFSMQANYLLGEGYNIAFNFDWSNTFNPVPFPVNAILIKQKAEAFFSYYKEYLAQIPFVVCENEWNNINYHKGVIADYLNELAIVVAVGHKYGFNVADAGLSGTGLQFWAYSKLDGAAKKAWAANYKVPFGSPNYKLLIKAVDQYAAGIKLIPIDYLNVHWYNTDKCYHGFRIAADLYMQLCRKENLITNEFGIRGTYSAELFTDTINEVKDNAAFAVLYSGNNAISISNEDIKNQLK